MAHLLEWVSEWRTAAAMASITGSGNLVHWSLPDPAAIGDADARRRAFGDVANALHGRISKWLAEASGRPPADVAGVRA
jgi:hypothetical protein